MAEPIPQAYRRIDVVADETHMHLYYYKHTARAWGSPGKDWLESAPANDRQPRQEPGASANTARSRELRSRARWAQ